MGLMTRFLRFFFRHFYHEFAWTYDFVAAVVSIGRWNHWIDSALPFVVGRRVLEIGHGPGHLQERLRLRHPGLIVGLDESPHMGRLSRNRLLKAGIPSLNLTRALAQSLPFEDGAFDVVVSTFPAEYIFERQTMQEVRRVLAAGGRFVVVPAAWIVGRKVLDRSAAWLFRATRQAPEFPPALMGERLRLSFEQNGFSPEFQTVELRSSEVLIVVAHPKSPNAMNEV
ncbi:MAG: class I SAM-dependent methyltransferase [Anaerolineales bacterium]